MSTCHESHPRAERIVELDVNIVNTTIYTDVENIMKFTIFGICVSITRGPTQVNLINKI